MRGLTREGNEVLPAGIELRKRIKGNSRSICSECKHVNDLCKDIWKRKSKYNGYTEIIECSGFEEVGRNK